MTQEEREMEREKIRKQTEEFLKAGGKITYIPTGEFSKGVDFNSYSDKDEV